MHLKGMTMPELLVTMIIAGILFLSVMDGFRLFYRYTSRVSDRISGNMDFYDSYYSLGELITAADSMVYNGENVGVYSDGMQTASLYEADSSIMMEVGERCDTILPKASFIFSEHIGYGLVDSLAISAMHNGESVRFSFMVNTPVEVRLSESAEEQESSYGYE